MNDEIKEIYLSNLDWTKTHDNIGGVMGNIVFKDNMSYEEFQKLFKSVYFVLCDKDYITNLQEDLKYQQEMYDEYCDKHTKLMNKYKNLQEQNERFAQENKNLSVVKKQAVEYIKFTSNLKYENEYVGLFIKDVCNNLLNILGSDKDDISKS